MRNCLPLFVLLIPVFMFVSVNTSPLQVKQGDFVNTKEMNTGQLTAIVANLAQLHEWELDHAPLLSSLTGRHLYFRIAQRAVGDRALLSRALKDLMGGSGYTEKALRTRMREMERDGYIASVTGEEDARSKYLMPTEKFYEAIYLHADQVRRIFEKDFLMIEKR
jgi:DNA-binding MarR family transcriptional regulator